MRIQCKFGGAQLAVISTNFDLGYVPDRPFTPEDGKRNIFRNGSSNDPDFNWTIAKLLIYSLILGYIVYYIFQLLMSRVYHKRPRAFE